MLKISDIDYLHNLIAKNGKAPVYYLAHQIELRGEYINEVAYKSVPSFKVIKIWLQDIQNALWEVQNFREHPEEYHTEQEERIIDADHKYIYYYTTQNNDESYTLPFNPRIPSSIYGTKRILFSHGKVIGEYNDPSPVLEEYTNLISYGDTNNEVALQMYKDGDLNWKYKDAPEGTIMDGIPYKYLTSDWYILKALNFPRTEHFLINVKKKNAFFLNEFSALSFKEEAEA